MTDAPTRITDIRAWEALDSRGRPTVGCAVVLESGAVGRVVVPSGASTGAYEAHELRDGGTRYGGYGTQAAVANLMTELRPAVLGHDALDQAGIDATLRAVDGTDTLSGIGANAVLAVSLAVHRAAAGSRPRTDGTAYLPLPMFNIVSGGAHAGGAIDLQDILAIPVGARTVAEAVEWGWRVRAATARLAAETGPGASLVADEGGIGVPLRSNTEALDLVLAGIEASGLRAGDDVAIAIDVAASQLATAQDYRLAVEERTLSAAEWAQELVLWTERYPIVSIEDPFGEDDWDSWSDFTARVGNRIQVVGDDLFATTTARLQRGVETRAANAVLVKPNQVGTVTATEELLEVARREGVRTVVSARSGDTEDHWLSDLAVGWGGDQLKVGSLTRSERTAKWNRLLELEADPTIPTELRRWQPLG
ncbi:MAG TPA: phosphopyruvate hydratase [Nonomuraea sp.]|nr:phosphopyruvate hydratase [Nonomuraea sp.]